MTSSDVTRREFMEAAVVTSGALLGRQLIPGATSPAAAQNAEAVGDGMAELRRRQGQFKVFAD